jgi:hypothetical protein
MLILYVAANFLAGAFICNCIPHLCAGLRGESFPTPFAKPPGQGKSSAVTNTLWGAFNLVVGALLLGFAPVDFGFNLPFALFLAGFLGIGLPMAKHFQKVREH